MSERSGTDATSTTQPLADPASPAGLRSSIRLMLADDHRMLREGLRRSLGELGFTVVAEARNGVEALDLAASIRPDVVLMDVTMPELDGVEATRQIKARQPDVRIVVLTMHADHDILTEAIRAGANGYLVKDCSTDEIAQAIEAVALGETALSPGLAASMLAEVRRQENGQQPERVITAREEEVLQLIADGCSTPEVAEQLFISQKTVKNHLASIYQKLDARDRTQAVLQAVRMGIVTLN
ncbi:MAG: response regulator transcription factor [Acidimicrobiia bacterium]|nr:response regulator transcription factor [Acidimicrobiia bacterium]